MKMKRIMMFLMAATCMFIQMNAQSDTLISSQVSKQKLIDNGGSGYYKSWAVTEKTLSGFTVYRPANVRWAGNHEGKLPIFIWCNGGCSDNNMGYERMLIDIASRGYLVVAIGQMKMSENERADGGSNERQVVDAINWLVKQERQATSDYYHAINVNNIALSGHSCGGAQAIANCANTRVKTLLIMNAGMGTMSMGGANPQTLKRLHQPIIYLTGGTGDVAYANAEVDYRNISHVPAVWADLSSAGHGGTYWNRYGGDFGRLAVKWLDWHLKGKTMNASIFLKPDLTEFKGWVIKNKNFKTTSYDDDYVVGTTVTDPAFDRTANSNFVFGADVSGLSLAEKNSEQFLNSNGVKQDFLAILKDKGMNAIRMRVWVSPQDNFCNKSDVQRLCARAKKQGLSVMIDFHYSDYWANGGNQYKPSSWASHSVAQLEKDVYNHTFDVLNTLKNAGVDVRWAQIGNEVENGLLWGEGRYDQHFDQFVGFINSAYKAVKAVNPDIQAVLHIGNGVGIGQMVTCFDSLQNAGAQWDVIGLSAFSKWSTFQTDEFIRKTADEIATLKERYGKPVMVVETGYENNRPLEANNYLCDMISQLMEVGCAGLFYWAPEATRDYEMGAWNPISRTPSVALDAFLGLRHTSVPYLMDITWEQPFDTVYSEVSSIQIPVNARHIRNRITQVDLMANGTPVATSTGEPFTINWISPERGAYYIAAHAQSSDGVTASTDTTFAIIGPMVNIEGSEFEYKSDVKYAQVWPIHLLEGGRYMMVFKYRYDDNRMLKVSVDNEASDYPKFSNTGGGYQYVTYTYTADGESNIVLRLQSILTRYAFPDILQLMVIPLDGQSLPDGNSTRIDNMPTSQTLFVRQIGQTLHVESAEKILQVSLYTATGQLVAHQTVNGMNVIECPCQGLAVGSVGLLRITTERGIHTSTFVVSPLGR